MRRIMCTILIIVVLLYTGIVLANDFTAAQLKKKLKDCPIPPNTRIIDTLSIAGKMSGNGNGMQWYGFLLVDSNLCEDDLTQWYKNAVSLNDDEWLYAARQETPYVFECPNIQFRKFSDNGKLYQICLAKSSTVGCEESTWESILNLDIRGH